MKKLLFIALSISVLASCVKNNTSKNERFKEAMLEKYSMTETFEVPVKEGETTIVKWDGEIIYQGNLPIKIDVPKWSTISRAADAIECFYVPDESDIASGVSHRRGILMFEDLPNGDNDYNDFVCEIKEDINIKKEKNGKYTIQLNGTHFIPQALGNSYTIPLGFGYELRDSKTGVLIEEVMLSTNVRDDWFDGKLGFLNTVPGGETHKAKMVNVKEPKLATELDNPIAINWFITANGAKHYTTDSYKYIKAGIAYNEVVMSKNVPFGLFTVCKNNDPLRNWAIEKCPIWEAYPNFTQWLAGKADNPFGQEVAAKLYR